MAKRITVLVVDDSTEARENIRKLLRFDDELEVVGEAENGQQALERARELHPEVILMDINMPVMDGITATERLSLELPECGVVMISVQGEAEYLRKSMIAGAREYLVKPFSGDELANTIKRVAELEGRRQRVRQSEPAVQRGKIVAVFSAKGGVGKTTLAANLAVALVAEAKARVALVDLDLQFGNIGVLMDIAPARTIADLVREKSIDVELLDSYLVDHQSGVRILPAPLRPEQADTITGAHVQRIVEGLRQLADYVVVDTPQAFTETTLAVLDQADLILLVATLELPAVKNVKLSLDVMESLKYPAEKIRLVLNRYSEEIGLPREDLERSLHFPVAARIPSDGRVVVASVNRGIPFYVTDPRSRVAQAIRDLAAQVAGTAEPEVAAAAESLRKRRGLAGLLHRR
ncbi:MAG TPA: response regulator [Firmicutes bacterium]|nr:response regulator [Bacillota bacterium]